MNIKCEKDSNTNYQLKKPSPYIPIHTHENETTDADNDSVIAMSDGNEIINVDESQSTQSLYQYVNDIKQELAEKSTLNTTTNKCPQSSTSKLTSNSESTTANIRPSIECEFCDQVNFLQQRDLAFNHYYYDL